MKLSASEIVTELLMSTGFLVHLLVEGETDRRLIASCLNEELRINILSLDGHEKVVDAISEIASSGVNVAALGIIDRDYRFPMETYPQLQNLLSTDSRDMECMMFSSRAFHSVLGELASEQKVRRFGGITKVLSTIVTSASEIGKLRFHYQKHGVPVSFKDIDVSRVIDKNTLGIDVQKYLRNLGQVQVPVCSFPIADRGAAAISVSTAMHAGSPYFSCPYLLCSGHDLVKILGVALRRAIGNRKMADVSEESIGTCLRLGYAQHFKSSLLATGIAGWLSGQLGVATTSVWV